MGKTVLAARAQRPGFTLIEALVCVSLVGAVSAAVFLLFHVGETSFIGGSEEGLAIMEAQLAMRALATDVRVAAAFVPPEHGGLRVLTDDGRSVEFYQEGRVLKRVERAAEESDRDHDDRDHDDRDHDDRHDDDDRGGRGRDDDDDDDDDRGGRGRGDGDDDDSDASGGGGGREATVTIASGLATDGGFTIKYYSESMSAVDSPRGTDDYGRAAVAQVTVVVPWSHDHMGRVKRTTLLAPRNDD